MKKSKNVFNNLLELVGNTPMVKIDKLTKSFPGTYLAKLEASNPGHSSKDRLINCFKILISKRYYKIRLTKLFHYNAFFNFL